MTEKRKGKYKDGYEGKRNDSDADEMKEGNERINEDMKEGRKIEAPRN